MIASFRFFSASAILMIIKHELRETIKRVGNSIVKKQLKNYERISCIIVEERIDSI